MAGDSAGPDALCAGDFGSRRLINKGGNTKAPVTRLPGGGLGGVRPSLGYTRPHLAGGRVHLPRLWPGRRCSSFPFHVQTSQSPGLPGLFVVANHGVGCSQEGSGPWVQNPFCRSRVWAEFDHLLGMFVLWKRALSVCFVSSAPKKYESAAYLLFYLIFSNM